MVSEMALVRHSLIEYLAPSEQVSCLANATEGAFFLLKGDKR